jgi:hypothetical protein
MVQVTRVPTSASKRLDIALKNLSGKVGKVGWFENAKYDTKGNPSVAYIATIQEYGYPGKNIPPRPFMRPTITAKQQQWRLVADQGVKDIIAGNATIEQVMDKIGLKAAADIKEKITLIMSPPLKPATIAARLRRHSNKKTVGNLTKPLIDTGYMYATLINTVENE